MSTAAGGGHLLHVLPFAVPLAAAAVVLLPDAVRGAARSAGRGVAVAGVATAAAAAVHLALVPHHLEEAPLYGAFFVAVGLVQLALAWAVLTTRPRALAATVLVQLAVVGLWALTRTVGVPVGPLAGEVEHVGVADLLAVALELVAAGGCALHLAAGRRRAPVLRASAA